MTSPDPRAVLADELLPCPFCGNAPVYPDYDAGDDDFVVVCKECGAMSTYSDDKSVVIKAWNTRRAPPAVEGGAVAMLEAEAARYGGEVVCYTGNNIKNILATQATRIRLAQPQIEGGAVREALEAALEKIADDIEKLYHRAPREFDLPGEPASYYGAAKDGNYWSCPYTPREISDFLRLKTDAILAALAPPQTGDGK